jgi:PAS domain S-box-containing protein
MVDPPTPAAPELPPGSISSLFPFFIESDAEFRIRTVGPSLQRVCPHLKSGVLIADAFICRRPDRELELASLRTETGVLWVLQEQKSELLLRGQALPLDTGGLLFIGSPWLSDTNDLSKYRLSIEDFAIHDPAVDLLHILRSQKMATDDLKRLTEKLRSQRTQLKEANTRLTTQETETRRLALIVERTDNAVLLADPKGRTEWINAGFTRLTGYTLDEVIGRIPGDVLQGPGSDPQTKAFMRERIRKKQPFQAEVLNYHKSGRQYWVSFEVQPLLNDAGEVVHFMAIERDITTPRAANAGLRTQFRIAQLLASDRSLEEVAEEMMEIIGSGLEWDVAILWMHDPDSDCLQPFQTWASEASAYDDFFSAVGTGAIATDDSLPGRTWRAKSAQWIENLGRYPEVERSSAAFAAGFKSAAATPIRIGPSALGVIEMVSRLDEAFDEDRLRVLAAMGSQIAQFVQRADSRDKLQQRSDELIRLNQDLAAANRAKDEFLASISHEIRTPLNGVIGAADALDATRLDAEQKEALDTIGASADHLHSLLNDVLDLSRIEAGHLALSPEPVEMSRFIEDTVRIFRPIARQKKLNFVLDAPTPPNLSVAIDATRLRQVLVNLLGNAFKFTSKGKVLLQFRHETSDGLVSLDFRIEDTGIGIPQDRVDQLFLPFSQLDFSRTRRFGGTGLGLAISRQLITMMAGTLELEPKTKPGSSFHVQLIAPAANMPAASKVASGAKFTTAEAVLVVDDNPFNARVIEMLLRQLDLKVHHCFNARDALNYCAETRPPIILMDLHMPDTDGMEATRQLRKHVLDKKQKRVPIVALTADVRPEVRQSCLDSGMDGFLAKPVRLTDLRAMLARHLQLQKPPAGAQPENTRPPPSPTPIDQTITNAVFNVGEDEATQAELRQMFTEMWDDIEPALKDIERLRAAGQIQQGQAACHGLLGVLGNFGLSDAAHELRRMESSSEDFKDPTRMAEARRSLQAGREALFQRYAFLRPRSS